MKNKCGYNIFEWTIKQLPERKTIDKNIQTFSKKLLFLTTFRSCLEERDQVMQTHIASGTIIYLPRVYLTFYTICYCHIVTKSASFYTSPKTKLKNCSKSKQEGSKQEEENNCFFPWKKWKCEFHFLILKIDSVFSDFSLDWQRDNSKLPPKKCEDEFPSPACASFVLEAEHSCAKESQMLNLACHKTCSKCKVNTPGMWCSLEKDDLEIFGKLEKLKICSLTKLFSGRFQF